jgi:hypothetical protein
VFYLQQIVLVVRMADELMKGMSQISIDDNNENRGDNETN